MTPQTAAVIPFPPRMPRFLSPADMAARLRRANPDRARDFAQVMFEDSAWANEEWGDYWADVLRLV